MKKKLENELMSLAHRVLQLRGRENIEELKLAAQELYEKLTVLAFTETHFEGPQPTIGRKEVEQALGEHSKSPQPRPLSEEKQPQPASTDQEKKAEPQERPSDRKVSKPVKPTSAEETPEKPKQTPFSRKDELRDIAVHYDDLPQFEPIGNSGQTSSKTEDEKSHSESPENRGTGSLSADKKAQTDAPTPTADLFSQKHKTKNDPNLHKKSLNERLTQGLKFGLNDRLAFINHLFDGSSTDFNRVVSQLNTFDNYPEAKHFIEQQVKPDYDWDNEEIYEERFFMIIEKRMQG